jgi:hypothetical protein
MKNDSLVPKLESEVAGTCHRSPVDVSSQKNDEDTKKGINSSNTIHGTKCVDECIGKSNEGGGDDAISLDVSEVKTADEALFTLSRDNEVR